MTDETHKSVHAAIATAAGQVKKLAKDDRNKFDGYDFVSIDSFLAMVNPICANNGLFPNVNQREFETYENISTQGKKSLWGRFFFDITLYHESGSSFGPTNMMVHVPLNGAQATGSAQSYALKQFFRSTFMIPTGDKDDADRNQTEAHTAATVSPEQYITLRDLAERAEVPEATICKGYDAPSLQQFPTAEFDSAVKKLNITIAKKAEQPAEPTDLAGDGIPDFEGELT